MERQDIIDFFDGYADVWDADMVRDDEIIAAILNHTHVEADKEVLDVACGTGVLIPDYLARDVRKITAIDISPKMIEIAKDKFCDERVCFVCGAVEDVELGQQYDCIMVYNAFPHFVDQARLIHQLSMMLKTGGRLSIAHGMSRDRINQHHAGRASRVSQKLISVEELVQLFEAQENELAVEVSISNEQMYQVVGVKK